MALSTTFNIDAPTPVASAYTVARRATGEARYRRQASEPGCYAHLILEVEPYTGTAHFEVRWNVAAEEVDPSYFHAAVAGIKEAAADVKRDSGAPGLPIVNVRVTVTGGSMHPIDSRDTCYKVAARMAFGNAIQQAGLVDVDGTHGQPAPK